MSRINWVHKRRPNSQKLEFLNPSVPEDGILKVTLKIAANFVVAGDLKRLCTRDIVGEIQGTVNYGNA